MMRFTQDGRTVLLHAGAHAIRLGHRQVCGEHFLLALVAAGSPAAEVLREHGVSAERVEEEIVRLEGLGAGASLFAGLDTDALAAIGVDLATVRARIQSSFAPEALAEASIAIHPAPHPRVPRSVRRLLRRRTRLGAPAPIPPPPPGLYQAADARRGGSIPAGPEARTILHNGTHEAQALGDPQTGAEHLALALLSTTSGLVPEILSRLGASPVALRAAVLGRYRQAS